MISVVVTTYERPRHLSLVLQGLAAQKVGEPFEVIVADDGSGEGTRAVVDRFRGGPFPLTHLWQEHRGFRAARARNLGLRRAAGDYVVFLDGDCIPFPDFLAAHRRDRRPGTFLCGGRIHLGPKETDALRPETLAPGGLRSLVAPSELRRMRILTWKDRFYTWTRAKDRPKVVTANLSAWLGDLQAVNGLDENFEGWGQEDEDLSRRLRRAGLKARSVVARALVCHLWHPPVESFHGRVRAGENIPYFTRGYYLTRCRNGLVKRPVTDLRTRAAGLPEPLGRAIQSRFAPATSGPCELEVLGPYGSPAAFSAAAEIRVAALQGDRAPPGRILREAEIVLWAGDQPGEVPAKGRRKRLEPIGVDLEAPGAVEGVIDALERAI